MREKLELKTTLDVIDNKKFQCELCLSRKSELVAKTRTLYGCERVTAHRVFKNNDFIYTKCPGNFYSYRAAHFLEVFVHFDKGVLPYPGGLMDQPAKIMDIFSVISAHRQDKLEAEVAINKSKERMKTRG